ncbi:AfsR/SARP family transcriptional regulator [Rugosimonospora africana]|uniref:AfsR/SARP family transcriptional regulator n=1 Tax=Rugosimonospora africana TaxID=556532 RepID=UPI0019408B01|nr:tetratricopeptide repeat protein [Rugosimonospora africana]
MRFLLLGRVEAVDTDERPLTLGRRRERCLLGLLLLNAGEPVTTERLVSLLWEEDPLPADPPAVIRTYVSRLRSSLDPADSGAQSVLIGRPGAYVAEVDPGSVDAHRFRESIKQARSEADGYRRSRLLTDALGLWRGNLMADVASDALRRRVGADLNELRAVATELLVDAEIEIGHSREMVGFLTGLVAENPLHEPFVDRLMMALQQLGRRAEAIEAYQSLREGLADALGIDPGPELQRRYLALLEGERPTEANGKAAATVTCEKPRGPAQLSPAVPYLIGRQLALHELNDVLTAQSPVVAVIAGTAGVGKTALAVYWAHTVASRFPGGQLYVDLGGFGTDQSVSAHTVLGGFLLALGTDPALIPMDLAGRSNTFRSMLAGRRVLVVLDNAQSAEQVRPLLPGAPGCLALVTSRDDLAGLVVRESAHRLILDRLAIPEAVDLLRRVLGAARVDTHERAAVELAELCVGLPLALKVAAERAARQPAVALTEFVADIADVARRLDAFDVPLDPTSAVRAVISWSYHKLTAATAGLFRILAVVPGPDIDAEGVAALAGLDRLATRPLLAELASAHLIEQVVYGRYHLHDLLRAYAAERLAVEDSETDRHAAVGRLLDWYLGTADAAARLLYPDTLRLPQEERRQEEHPQDPAVRFRERGEALTWLTNERANLIAATGHASRHGPQRLTWELYDALRGYLYQSQDLDDLLQAGRTALVAAEENSNAFAQTIGHLGIGAALRDYGDYDRAIQHYTDALEFAERAGWPDGCASANNNLGSAHLHAGQLRLAAEHFKRATDISRVTGKRSLLATHLGNLGLANYDMGNLRQSAECYEEALTIEREIGNQGGEARALHRLGNAEHRLGRLSEALHHLDTALTMYRKVGYRSGEAGVLDSLAGVHRDAGRYQEALEYVRSALAIQEESGGRFKTADGLITLASIQDRLGRSAVAYDNYQEALTVARQTEARHAEVTALIGLGTAVLRLGQIERARRLVESALAIAQLAGYRALEGDALSRLATSYETEDAGRALDCAQRALEIYQETGMGPDEARIRLRGL